ncbi:MAG: NUDIX domain-containing protein [Planctomycetota bacterium]
MPDPVSPGNTTPVHRNAGRVLLLDPDDRILLLACRDPDRPDAEPWWITPGGGCEPGESHADAAQREAREETGFTDLTLGPHAWTRTHTFPWLDQLLTQHEHFFRCRTDQPQREPTTRFHTQDELLYLQGHRWWSIPEITTARAAGTQFAPRQLDTLLADLFNNTTPLPRTIGP